MQISIIRRLILVAVAFFAGCNGERGPLVDRLWVVVSTGLLWLQGAPAAAVTGPHFEQGQVPLPRRIDPGRRPVLRGGRGEQRGPDHQAVDWLPKLRALSDAHGQTRKYFNASWPEVLSA